MPSFMYIFIQGSASMSLITLIYLAVLPLLAKRYSAKWLHFIWQMIILGWLLPMRPQIDLPHEAVQPLTGFLPISSTGKVGDTTFIYTIKILTVIWVIVVFILITYHVWRHVLFTKALRRWSEPATDIDVLALLEEIKLELGVKQKIQLSICHSCSIPMLVGFVKPRILLPARKLKQHELSFIFRHELIHFKRNDLWYKLFIATAMILHWFNPLVYFLAKSAQEQCEISCDELVLKNADNQQRRAYGEMMIGMIRSSISRQALLTTYLNGGTKKVKKRISLIMDKKKKHAAIGFLCIALVGIVLPGTVIASTNEINQLREQLRNYEASASASVEASVEDRVAKINQENEELREALRNYEIKREADPEMDTSTSVEISDEEKIAELEELARQLEEELRILEEYRNNESNATIDRK